MNIRWEIPAIFWNIDRCGFCGCFIPEGGGACYYCQKRDHEEQLYNQQCEQREHEELCAIAARGEI